MNRPAVTAIDQIVAEVIAPALNARGFKRRGRRWTHATEAVHRGLDVQRSQLNRSNSASFTLNVRFAFLELDHEPFVATTPAAADVDGYGNRIGPYITDGGDHWWECRTSGGGPTVDAFVRGFARDWDELVLPLFDSADDPRRFCTHLTLHGPLRGVFIAFRHAEQLGDPDLIAAAFDRALELARRLEPSPHKPEDRVKTVGWIRSAPPRLHHLYAVWANITAMAQRTGRQLDGADHERAEDALRWSAEVYLPSMDASPSEGDGARDFAERLGIDPATLDLTPEALRQKRAEQYEILRSHQRTRPRRTG